MRHDSLGPALDCPQVQERLPLFVGEDLERDMHAAVVQHLLGCGVCRGHETLARVARERFRGVLDESLRSCTRVGLWPELRARMVGEGLLAGARPAEAPAPLPEPVSGADSSVPATRAESTLAPRARRGLRLLVPLAAAAAVLVTLFASDPFRRTVGVGTGPGPSVALPSTTPIVPVADVAGSGGLRRLAAEERSLSQDAEPLQRDGLVGQRPARLAGTTLVSYR